MRHHCIAKKFGRKPAHRKALMESLTTNLLLHGSIKTGLDKAKQARRDAEKLVTLARKGTLAARRLCAARLQSPKAVQILFDSVVPALAKYTKGGYTRILKLAKRRIGDGAEMCILQWVTQPEAVATTAPVPADAKAVEAKVAEPAKETPKAEKKPAKAKAAAKKPAAKKAKAEKPAKEEKKA